MMNLSTEEIVQRIKELEENLKLCKDALNVATIKDNLKGLSVGYSFTLAGLTWVILAITDEGYKCLASPLREGMVFDTCSNNWRNSKLRSYLNSDFLSRISHEIGEKNIKPFKRNLMSLDGQTEYGHCIDTVSLLTVDEYRLYRDNIISTSNNWWYLLTAWGTPKSSDSTHVISATKAGTLFYNFCYKEGDIRPVCTFASSLFE